MKFESDTFFIGMIDFFSVLLPGAVLAAAFQNRIAPILIGPVLPGYGSEPACWALFLFASYLLGHFIFLLGAHLDPLYDRLPKRLFAKDPRAALERAIELKNRRVPDVDGRMIINAFQWAKARLAIQCPAALAEVQRFEADSKFFRSLVVVLLVLAIWYGSGGVPAMERRWWLVGPCVVLGLLSFWRYAERRFKATQQAYWYVITLETCPPPAEKGAAE